MNVLRGKTVQIPVTSLVRVADGAWEKWTVPARFSGTHFTIFLEPKNTELVNVFTSNNWTPVDRTDLSKGLIEVR